MKDVSKNTDKPRTAMRLKDPYVVAVGASAGGLEAIHEFFDHMPVDASFSFVVIQHLSPDYKSLLVELVSKHTHMKVFEAAHNLTLQPHCVYIIPNNKLMTISQNKLKLADKSVEKAPNTAIDTFLVTLAHEKRDKAIAIILSGTGTDGTKGIEAIKDNGGLVLVQDPSTAKFDGMPNSAITSGNADFVLAPGKMHEELYNHVNREPINVLENGRLDDTLLEDIFGMVHQQSGHDFNLYKTPTIIRRIARRMNHHNIKTLSEYVDLLKQDQNEVVTLGKDFLIGVTKFFRDKAAFDILAKQVIPAIVEKKADGEVLKVWVCACSTGEEAYSVAVLINDHLEKVNKKLDLKIFATDIDESSIEIASKNLYPAAVAKEISGSLLKKYFLKEGKYYSVIPPIRKQIVFAKHNVTKAPPFIKNDLVTCRNMLIYMNTLLQQKVLSTFHFSLNQGGYLFLGSSETVSSLKDGLKEISSKWKIYQKTGKLDYAPQTYHHTALSQSEKTKPAKLAEPAPKSLEDDFRDFIVNDIGFVGIFIDRNYEIKETVGDFKKYLSLPEKKLDLNVLKMVPREVAAILNTAIRKAWKDNTKTYLNRIRIRRNNEDMFLNISVKPAEQTSASPYTLIVFGESWADGQTDKNGAIITDLHEGTDSEYVLELEAELNETRNNLQMAVEEMETTNEELQSSNEELLSANEELQSSNEELQSLNEELHTLNTEHQLKIKELIELNDDLDNYFKSTDIGQIFLDASLRIRKFNPAVVSMVNLIEADIGRPISHISNNIKYDNLINDINLVLKNGSVVEKEIQVNNGSRSLMRIMPYVRKDKRNDGVVISFVDISVVTELNNIITGVFNASNSAILAFKSVRNASGHIIDFKCTAANNAAVTFLKKSEEDLHDAVLVKQLPELTENGFFDKYIKVVETGKTMQAEYILGDKSFFIVAVKMADGFAATLTDITQRKAGELKLKKNFNDLISAREDLKRLNTDLEGMVKERTLELSQSEERFKLVSKATNDTIWDWNMVNNTMWRSENFTSMFGYHINEETENIGFWFDRIHPDDRKRVESSVYDAINTGKKQWSAEYRFLKADKSYAIILDRGSILHDDFKTPYRMVGSIIDVTRLIEAEKRVSSSENRFRKIFESNMIGMLFADKKGRIVDANDAVLNMIGYTRDELKQNGIRWADITPPEYQEISNRAVKQMEETGVCPPFEKQYIKKDGSRVSILMGSARLNEDSEFNAVSYIINITDQKETERRKTELQNLIKKQQEEFYSIFMNAPALITIRRGKDLRYEFTNKAFDNFDGRAPYNGKTSFEAHPERRGGRFSEIDKHVLKTGEPYVGKAFHFQRLDAQTNQLMDCWFDFIFTPVFTDDDNIDGIAFFGFDVTDLIKAQQATKQLMQKKDEFMSIASHELKTPITSLKGSLQIANRLAGKKSDISSLFPFIEKANRQTDKLTTLVDDLLDVTKIQEGKMLFNYTNFNAGDMIRECIEEVQANNASHNIELVGHADQVIYADRPRLEQVISNFLSNAIKYSPEASKVVVTGEVKNNMLKISVRDFGIGIPPDKKEFVFDRFFRVQESSHKFSGLGLGLYISAEIIKRHHGMIGVDSKENEGSTFWFQLPASSN
jgi:two-component system CheB/CheR fusion protein